MISQNTAYKEKIELEKQLEVLKKEVETLRSHHPLESGKFEAAFRANPNAIILSTHNEGIILDVNDSFTILFDRTKQEALGHTTLSLHIYDNPSDRNLLISQLQSNGRIVNWEIRVRRKSGEIRTVLISAETFLYKNEKTILTNFLDITDIKRVEEELRYNKGLFQQLVESANSMIFRYDTNGTVLFVNDFALRFFGYTRDEMMGKNIMMVVPKMDQSGKEIGNLVNEIVSTPDKFELNENENIRKNGERVWVAWTNKAICNESGNTLEILAIGTDFTHLKKAEEKILENEKRLEGIIVQQKKTEQELKQKNAQLTSFVYTVSHDLKSPLVTIKAFSSYLIEDIENQDKEAQEKDIQYIHNAADKMGRLLDELLELSRIGRMEGGKLEVRNSQIVQSALDLLAGSIALKKPKIILCGPEVLINGHQQRLIQLYQNLIENAIKFMGDQPDPEIQIGTRVIKNEITFFVKDNGSGIDPRYHHKVFGLFEKLNTQTEGIGIGLALVKKIVESHNGQIWFRSEGSGKGAAFYFMLEYSKVLENKENG